MAPDASAPATNAAARIRILGMEHLLLNSVARIHAEQLMRSEEIRAGARSGFRLDLENELCGVVFGAETLIDRRRDDGVVRPDQHLAQLAHAQSDARLDRAQGDLLALGDFLVRQAAVERHLD